MLLNTTRLLLFASLVCSGCADVTSIFRQAPLSGDQGKIFSVDAKQREVIVKRGDDGDIVCAEKSPDALTVFAASFSGSLTVPNQAAGSLAAGLTETGANIGVRTAAIEALSRQMYVICEGYLNGALSSTDFATLHRRWQNKMVAMMAIENLTGAIRPSYVAIGGSTTADTGKGVNEAQKALDDAKADQKKKLDASDAANKQADTNQSTADELKKALPATTDSTYADKKAKADEAQQTADASNKTADSAKKTLDEANQNVAALQKNVDSARNAVGATTSSMFAPGNVQISSPPSASASKDVAEAVKYIIHDMFSESFEKDTCESIIVNPKLVVNAAFKAIVAACQDFVTQKVQDQANQLRVKNQEFKLRFGIQ